MYSICSLDQNDVLKSIIAMKQRGYRGPVLQITAHDYERLKYQKDSVRDFADALLKDSNLSINLLNNTLHSNICEQLQHVAEQELVSCHIIDPIKSGLKMCPCCTIS
jgi:hypothetical protein